MPAITNITDTTKAQVADPRRDHATRVSHLAAKVSSSFSSITSAIMSSQDNSNSSPTTKESRVITGRVNELQRALNTLTTSHNAQRILAEHDAAHNTKNFREHKHLIKDRCKEFKAEIKEVEKADKKLEARASSHGLQLQALSKQIEEVRETQEGVAEKAFEAWEQGQENEYRLQQHEKTLWQLETGGDELDEELRECLELIRMLGKRVNSLEEENEMLRQRESSVLGRLEEVEEMVRNQGKKRLEAFASWEERMRMVGALSFLRFTPGNYRLVMTVPDKHY